MSSPRNFENCYYTNRRDRTPYRVGRAVTLKGAVRAAFTHVVAREYDKAVVYDPIGLVQFTIKWVASKQIAVIKGV